MTILFRDLLTFREDGHKKLTPNLGSVLQHYLGLFPQRMGTYNFQLQVVVVHFGVAVDTDEYGIEAGRNKSEAEYVLGSIRPLIRGISVLHHPSIDAPFIGHGLCNE